jgi:KDO2-lipid IV(A) lauroyltransferase
LDVIYRYNKNPLIERTMVEGRARYFPRIIEREDARAILTSLREGRTLWYAADQDYGARHSVFADFFGVPAATITGTARLARFNGSPVLLLSHYRDPANHRWLINISPSLADYPSDNAEFDATRTNALIEAAIRKAPEQYLWMHRRFKTRPVGEPGVY